MNLESKITDLIELLDERNDTILVLALKEKLNQMKEKYMVDYFVSDNEKKTAIRGISKSLSSTDLYLKKCNKIREIFNCENCRFAVEEKEEYKYYNHQKCMADTKRCDRCFERERKMREIEETRKKYLFNLSRQVPDDIISLKALINKINNKHYEFLHYKK